MATPPGPASPGNPISYDDIRSETRFTPNIDLGLDDFGTYQYDDGFVNDKTFYNAYYPVPSSPSGGAGTQNLSISYFYDIDSVNGLDINFSSGSPPWVSAIDVSFTDVTNLSSYSNIGPNHTTTVQFFGLGYGTQGGNTPHWADIDITVGIQAIGPPPFNPSVNVEYDTGAGWTAFPGTPTNMPGNYATGPIANVANGGIIYVQVY